MKTPEPTANDIAELVAFLPRLHAPGEPPIVRWRGGVDKESGVSTFPWPEYSAAVSEFADAASKECWCDGEYLSRGVNEILDQENGVANLGIDEIKSVLTLFVRGERFCDGHWAGMIEAGHMRRVLERLAELGAEGAAVLPQKETDPPAWSESLQQQTRTTFEELWSPPDGLLHMKHKVLGYAVIRMEDFLQNGLLVCESKDGRRWKYPDVEALLTDGWVID